MSKEIELIFILIISQKVSFWIYAIKRFLGIIKDAINGEVYDQLFDYKYYRRDGQNHLPIATDHQREIHIFLQDEMKPFKTQK
jgi:hypothetical protein